MIRHLDDLIMAAGLAIGAVLAWWINPATAPVAIAAGAGLVALMYAVPALLNAWGRHRPTTVNQPAPEPAPQPQPATPLAA